MTQAVFSDHRESPENFLRNTLLCQFCSGVCDCDVTFLCQQCGPRSTRAAPGRGGRRGLARVRASVPSFFKQQRPPLWSDGRLCCDALGARGVCDQSLAALLCARLCRSVLRSPKLMTPSLSKSKPGLKRLSPCDAPKRSVRLARSDCCCCAGSWPTRFRSSFRSAKLITPSLSKSNVLSNRSPPAADPKTLSRRSMSSTVNDAGDSGALCAAPVTSSTAGASSSAGAS